MTSDPISSVAALLAIFVGAAIANAIAPHLVVFAGGFLGAYLGLMRWRDCTRTEAWGYMAAGVLGSWLFTGTLVVIAQKSGLEIEDKLLIAPAATVISFIGHQWADIGRWAVGVLGRMIERRTQA